MDCTFSGIVLPVQPSSLDVCFSDQILRRLIDRYATSGSVHLILNRILVISKVHLNHPRINNRSRKNVRPFRHFFQTADLPDIALTLRMIAFILNRQIPIRKIVPLNSGIIIILTDTLHNQKSNIVWCSIISKTDHDKFICCNIFCCIWSKWSKHHCSKCQTGLQLLVHV